MYNLVSFLNQYITALKPSCSLRLDSPDIVHCILVLQCKGGSKGWSGGSVPQTWLKSGHPTNHNASGRSFCPLTQTDMSKLQHTAQHLHEPIHTRNKGNHLFKFYYEEINSVFVPQHQIKAASLLLTHLPYLLVQYLVLLL